MDAVKMGAPGVMPADPAGMEAAQLSAEAHDDLEAEKQAAAVAVAALAGSAPEAMTPRQELDQVDQDIAHVIGQIIKQLTDFCGADWRKHANGTAYELSSNTWFRVEPQWGLQVKLPDARNAWVPLADAADRVSAKQVIEIADQLEFVARVAFSRQLAERAQAALKRLERTRHQLELLEPPAPSRASGGRAK